MRKYKVALEKEEREELETIIQKGNHTSQKVLNALVLLNSDQGQFQDRVGAGQPALISDDHHAHTSDGKTDLTLSRPSLDTQRYTLTRP
jgi:hypothetical protein